MSKSKEVYDKFVKFIAENVLNIEVKHKFEELLLVDGVTKITVEPALEVGAAIALYAEDGTPVAAPIAEYELADGRIIVVEVEGVIAAIKDAVVEEELDADGNPKAKAPDASPDSKVKELIERIEKVSKYATEEVAKFKKENEFFHAENEALKVKLDEVQNFVKDFMESVLEIPVAEPVKKQKNAFQKEAKPNIFLNRKQKQTA